MLTRECLATKKACEIGALVLKYIENLNPVLWHAAAHKIINMTNIDKTAYFMLTKIRSCIERF